MRRLFVLALLAASPILADDLPLCDDIKSLSKDVAISAPAGAETAVILKRDEPGAEKVITFTTKVANNKWQPTEAEVNTVKDASWRTTLSRPLYRFAFLNAQGNVIERSPFKIAGEKDEDLCRTTLQPPPSITVATTEICMRKAGAEQLELERRSKLTNDPAFTMLVFNPDGQVCYWNRPFGVEGDPIHVYVLDDGTITGNPTVEFAPCALEPAAPSLFVSGKFPTITEHAGRKEPELKPLPVQRCFDPITTIKTSWRHQDPVTDAEEDVNGTFSLKQYRRYRAGLQIGTSFTDLHDETFGVQTIDGKQRLYSKGPEDEGPEYVATVVLYSLPRSVREAFGGPRFYGRDIVNDQGFQDRLGGVIGVGLNNPGRRFVAGLSLEVFRGVNVIGLLEYGQVKRLAGFKVGDEFAGTEATIPTTDTWDHNVTFGVSLDVRYVTALFTHE
jgi:hypothetical protein